MRYLLAAILVSASIPALPATAQGLAFQFPTLTWPVATPAPEQPSMGCADPASLTPVLCPAPSR